jgi:hypothetical protein
MRLPSLLLKWSGLERTKHSYALRLMSWLALAAAIAGIVLLTCVLLSALPAVVIAITAGVLVGHVGQHWRLKTLRASSFPANLASFQFHGAAVQCLFDEAAVARYVHGWMGRVSAAIAAGGICMAALHFPELQPNLLPKALLNLSWLHRFIHAAKPALPVLTGGLFLTCKGPTRYWAGQVKRAIEQRASASIGEILSHREIRGLGTGIDTLWAALGIERQGEYQAAIERHLQMHTFEIVIKPEAAIAVQETLLVLGRQDLRSLGDALAAYRSAECRIQGVRTLAAAVRNPVHEMKAEDLSAELVGLQQLAAERCWDEFHRSAASLQSKIDELDGELKDRAVHGPPVVLAPGIDPYQLLGVTVDTPTPLVRKLRIRLAQLYHPDISDSAQNGRKMAELNAAYDAVMKDREKKGR